MTDLIEGKEIIRLQLTRRNVLHFPSSELRFSRMARFSFDCFGGAGVTLVRKIAVVEKNSGWVDNKSLVWISLGDPIDAKQQAHTGSEFAVRRLPCLP